MDISLLNPILNISTKYACGNEVFGPAAAIIVADDEIETVRLANDSQYGLGASIWMQDLDKARNCQEWFDQV